MDYIRKVITREEKLLAIFRPHWIYIFEGAFWFVFLTVAGLIADYLLYSHYGLNAASFSIDLWFLHFDGSNTPIPWIFSLCGLAVFWPLFLVYISSEVGLTNQRIIFKRGLFFIEIDQVDLEDIRAEHVFHGWLGWALGYGRVRLDCRFIDDVWLPAIRNPYRLIKASHTARMKHPGIDYAPDELHANLARAEQKREAAMMRGKILRFKESIKSGFRKAS